MIFSVGQYRFQGNKICDKKLWLTTYTPVCREACNNLQVAITVLEQECLSILLYNLTHTILSLETRA